jgi:hypothetical protein
VIVARLQGGHSNQLFQYATARCVAERRNAEAYMDPEWFAAIPAGDTRRIYELDGYRFEQRLLEAGDVSVADDEEPGRPHRRIRLFARRRSRPILRRYRQQGHGFDPQVLDLPDDTYLDGWWQDERYFSEIRSILLDELQLREAPSERAAHWLREMEEPVSVSLHVRRGDYVTNPAAGSFHGLLGPAYYEAALERLVAAVGEPGLKVFVFSNDIEWCKNELRLAYPTSFVDSGNSGPADMRLMRSCRHHVVANSSFSWWGAWLSDHPGKVVVAPDRWFADPVANAETEIVPRSWLRI